MKATFSLGFLALFALACSSGGSSVPDDIFADLGEPLPSATSEQLEIFERGQAAMLKRFTVEEGLGANFDDLGEQGKGFNVVSCAGCHEKPVIGGSASHYRDFLLVGKENSDGSFELLGRNGIQVHYQFVDGAGRVPTDPEANVFATRNPLAMFGVGLINEIDEDAILKHVDEDDRDGDGISGKANFSTAGLFSRFGIKAQNPDIESFVRGPLQNHMGVTASPLSSSQVDQLPKFAYRLPILNWPIEWRAIQVGLIPSVYAQGGVIGPLTNDGDEVPDPEINRSDFFDVVAASMLFAAPKPDAPTADSEAGEKLFKQIRCAACHIPTLKAKRGAIPLFSDLLVHDMGEDLDDGIKMGRAESFEFRTSPLWGVAATAPYLHDGRADTIEQAILMHGGEALASKTLFADLPETKQKQIIAFLESLGGKSQASAGLLEPDAEVPDAGEFGGPIDTLSASDLNKFKVGRAVFDRDFGISEGMGPKFNGDSCRSCHFDPVIGGSGPPDVNVIRQGRVVSGAFSFPTNGDTMVSKHSTTGSERPEPDSNANVFEHRQTPPLFGLGLIDRIPDAQITPRADPADSNGDGISGKARIIGSSGKPGRFGWKGNIPALTDFIHDALSNEMGITVTASANGFGRPNDGDGIADPEIGSTDLNRLVFFLKNLAPPPRNSKNASNETIGEGVFNDIGCAKCHTPSMTTSDSVTVNLYSDLLLHDVAPTTFEGIEDGDDADPLQNASMREFRTPPLWGLSRTAPYMHDGSAATILKAIQAHHGEAENPDTSGDGKSVIQRFGELNASDTNRLLDFLESL